MGIAEVVEVVWVVVKAKVEGAGVVVVDAVAALPRTGRADAEEAAQASEERDDPNELDDLDGPGVDCDGDSNLTLLAGWPVS